MNLCLQGNQNVELSVAVVLLKVRDILLHVRWILASDSFITIMELFLWNVFLLFVHHLVFVCSSWLEVFGADLQMRHIPVTILGHQTEIRVTVSEGHQQQRISHRKHCSMCCFTARPAKAKHLCILFPGLRVDVRLQMWMLEFVKFNSSKSFFFLCCVSHDSYGRFKPVPIWVCVTKFYFLFPCDYLLYIDVRTLKSFVSVEQGQWCWNCSAGLARLNNAPDL